MPRIKYVDKKIRKAGLLLIQQVNDVVAEYSAQGFDLTLRQVYYQLVSRAIIENNERSYKNLGNLVSDARLAGMIDWNAIEDRTRYVRSLNHWEHPRDIVGAAAQQYRRDHWEGQESYVEVWVEKDALIGIVGQICNDLDVSHFSCRGYVSQSEMWGAAQRLHRAAQDGKHIVLLHLGDHDPSGKDMSRDIVDRLETFGVGKVSFKRLALNMAQIEKYNPPPNPTKLTDSRAVGYISEYGYECWELDALEPKVISTLIKTNVEQYVDRTMQLRVLERERREKQFLNALSNNYDALENNWEAIKGRYC